LRWRFFDPTNGRETAVRERVVSKIDAWWREFASKTDELSARFAQKTRWDLSGWMAENLGTIAPQLMWEFGPGVQGGAHRLVITPEARHDLRPLVATIFERAPVIDGWEFYPHRLPEDLASTILTVDARAGCDIRNFQVRANRGDHHRIDLRYASPSVSKVGDQNAFNAAFVATETLLGESCLDRWIGAIEVGPLPGRKGFGSLFRSLRPAQNHFLPLERMKDTVEAVIGSIVDQLPPRPHVDSFDEAEWSLWKLEPEISDDYFMQLDLFVVLSVNPAMSQAARGGGLFFSERFSRCGETFCFVKVDRSQGLDDSQFAERSEIQDALDEVLKPEKLGCCIGGGTGRRYSYVDLALVDVDRGIHAIRRRLQAGNVPKRTWIQFFDADLAAEWVGIFDESPPPPMQIHD
jgi:hypothetical protein